MKIRKFFNESLGEIRTSIIDGAPHFVASDVCAVLEIKNSSDAVAKLDDDEKVKVSVSETGRKGGSRYLMFVNEYGLWGLVFHSRKPQAREFKRWLSHEVIPSIRRSGMYVDGQDRFAADDLERLNTVVRDLTSQLIHEQESLMRAEERIEVLQKEAARSSLFDMLEEDGYYDE